MGFLAGLLDFIFPPKCVFCGKFLDSSRQKICEKCQGDLPFTEGAGVSQKGEFFETAFPPFTIKTMFESRSYDLNLRVQLQMQNATEAFLPTVFGRNCPADTISSLGFRLVQNVRKSGDMIRPCFLLMPSHWNLTMWRLKPFENIRMYKPNHLWRERKNAGRMSAAYMRSWKKS